MKIALAIVLLAGMAQSQTVKVIALTPEETKQARALVEEQKKLTERTSAFDASIRDKYLTEPANDGALNFRWNGRSSYNFKDGWSFGQFIYSDDFKFIVPSHYGCQVALNNGCQSFAVAN